MLKGGHVPDAATAENWDFDPREKLASFVIAIDTSEAITNVDRLLAKLQEIEALTKRLGVKLVA